jgi:hypothetical protein
MTVVHLLRNSAINAIIYLMKRRSYKIDSITVNGKACSEVVIDPHYEEKHSEHINDELILALVKRLNGRRELPNSSDDKFTYFVTMVDLNEKIYRLVWLLEDNTVYIGVVNAFRDGKGELQ